MQIFTNILLGFLIICAIAASLSKNLLNTILIFMSYSLVNPSVKEEADALAGKTNGNNGKEGGEGHE